MMKNVILISGKAENGKSETGRIIKKYLENRGERVLVIPNARYLKLYMELLGFNNDKKDEKYRQTIQRLGTEKIRESLNKPLFHTHRICEDMEILENQFDYFIVDDCRFINEVEYPKAVFPNKVRTIRVNRLGHRSSLTVEQLKHRSEVELDGYIFDEYFNVSNLTELDMDCQHFVMGL